ncbi:hypothetical protein HMPREF9404_5752 [Eggerthella sp. HGA1]|nr:hypothetical protein HMPREF9404_5752 [Eggerthella sp. HGA1]
MQYGTHDTASRGARSDDRPRLTRITRANRKAPPPASISKRRPSRS